jgi:hypothetical protein
MNNAKREDIQRTIMTLCSFLNPDRLDKVWKKAYKLAIEQMEEKNHAPNKNDTHSGPQAV